MYLVVDLFKTGQSRSGPCIEGRRRFARGTEFENPPSENSLSRVLRKYDAKLRERSISESRATRVHLTCNAVVTTLR